VTELATSRYADFTPAMGVPVQTSIGRPKFPIRYDLTEEVRDLMPRGLFGKDLSETEFTARYRGRLDKIGVDRLRRQFDAISRRHGGERLICLCYEDVHAGQFCHRRIFADWWQERTGQVVPEVEDPQLRLDPQQLRLDNQEGTTP
jgi:hypothetical protein